MFFEKSLKNLEILIAKAANATNKPFIHSVVCVSGAYDEPNKDELDITFNILCRDCDGKRLERYDLELEIYNSKNELNMVITKLNFPDDPILWSGNKNLWLESNNGKKCDAPNYYFRLENLATNIRNSLN